MDCRPAELTCTEVAIISRRFQKKYKLSRRIHKCASVDERLCIARFPFSVIFNCLFLICKSHWSEFKSDLDEWVFVKSNFINSLLNLWGCVKLCRKILKKTTTRPEENIR